jgi:hypothetical protein
MGDQESVTAGVEYSISLSQYWNLISLSVNDSIEITDLEVSYDGENYTWNEATTGLDPIMLSYVYGWNRSDNIYELVDTLIPGEGYWVWSYYDDVDLKLTSEKTSSDDITDLVNGWNIMGLPDSSALSKENIIIHYDGTDYTWNEATSGPDPIILGFIYEWNRASQQYDLSNSLIPTHGHWMFAYYDCTIKQ